MYVTLNKNIYKEPITITIKLILAIPWKMANIMAFYCCGQKTPHSERQYNAMVKCECMKFVEFSQGYQNNLKTPVMSVPQAQSHKII